MYKLLKEIKDNNVFIKLSDEGKLIVKVPRDRDLQDLLSEIKLNKDFLVNYLKSKEVEFKEIPAISNKDSYPLSSSQYRLWVLSQFEDGNIAYNIPSQITLNEINDIPSLHKAIDAVINRHEILRTVFKTNNSGEVRQHVLSKDDIHFNLEYFDFRNESNPEDLAQGYIKGDSYKPFDLEKGPLLRGALLHVAQNTLIFYYNMHHIISDGWSIHVMYSDVQAFYNAFLTNTEVKLPKLRIQYKDYAAWQLYKLHTDELKQSKEYWFETLSDATQTLSLPTSKLRPNIKSYQGSGLHTTFSKETTHDLMVFSKEHGGSAFMTVLSLWYVLLYKYTLQEDLIIGAPIAGRDHPDLENQIGFFVNTLALRNKIDPTDSFLNFYEQVKTSTLKAYDNQAYPFDKIVEDLNLPYNSGRNMLFDVILAYQNMGGNKENNIPKHHLTHEITDKGACFSNFDLEIKFEEVGGYLHLDLVYNIDIYEKDFIERLLKYYKLLLSNTIASPDKTINEIDFLEAIEKEKVLHVFNNTQSPYPNDKTVVDVFQEQAKKAPDSIALIVENEKITYKELDELSDQLANHIQNVYTISNDDLIGVKLKRDKWLLITLLAVLKTGGCYVPIDINYPETRIKFIEKDTNCVFTIDEKFIKNLDFSLVVDSVNNPIKPTNLACVLYTSGSSGNPKGVMITHRNIVSLVKPGDFFKLEKGDILLSTSSVSFDASIIEFYGTLLNGASLVIEETNDLLNPEFLRKIISQHAVNCFWMTSPWFNTLINNDHIEIFENITKVIVGGDVVSPSHVKKLYEKVPTITVSNGYGPTENTTFSTTYAIKAKKQYHNIPIGTPIPNSSVYILNPLMNPVPVDLIGEIFLSGPGVAKGYLNDEQQTQQKFVKNPFVDGEILYKTGDFGRWLPDGNVEFKGRMDRQVKLRGFRVEPEEIEYVLLNYQGIKQAIVLIEELNGEDTLISYFISDRNIEENELKTYLQKTLPYYMVPQYYVPLEKIPLTPNGKIDKKALPTIDIKETATKEFLEPTNEIEKKLVVIWQEILHIEKISINDNFFQLGGHSLKMIIMMNKIKEHFDVDIKVDYLYQTPTISDIGQYVSFFKNKNKDNDIENIII